MIVLLLVDLFSDFCSVDIKYSFPKKTFDKKIKKFRIVDKYLRFPPRFWSYINDRQDAYLPSI